MVLVLDLGLGEGGLEWDGPIDGLLAAVDEALFDEAGEGAKDVGLERRRLRLVLVFPIREDAEALELAGLRGDPGLGKGVAALAKLRGGEGFLLRLDLAGDLLFDRQAVAVPARDVGRAATAHRAVAERDVLERLVQRGADVDIAVGERRAVVEDEGCAGGVLRLDARVEVELLPVRHPLRFASHEVGPHGKIGLGQVQGVFQVGGHAGEKGARG